MLASQSDPVLILSLAQQRHAELVADVRHHELVEDALRHVAARVASPGDRTRGLLGRFAALVAATLRLTPMAPTPAQGA